MYTDEYTLAGMSSNPAAFGRPASPVAPPARRLLGRAERRAAILAAAAPAFADRGFAGTSMDDVAAAAGVTKLIVYRHFDSKESLYEAVLTRVVDRLVEEFGARLKEDRRGLSAVGALLAVAREDPAALTLLWRHAAREPQFASYAATFRDRAYAFARALLSEANVPARLLPWAAETVVSYVFEALLHWLDEGAPGRDDEFLHLMAASLPAIARSFAHPATP